MTDSRPSRRNNRGNNQQSLNLGDKEHNFLQKNRDSFSLYGRSPLFTRSAYYLVDSGLEAQTASFDNEVESFKSTVETKGLFPQFQAASILAEELTESSITFVLRLLRRATLDHLFQVPPAREDVVRALEPRRGTFFYANDSFSATMVIAGFIRLLEFGSALDNLFPDPTEPFADIIKDDSRDQMVKAVRAIIDWRFPKTGLAREAYRLVYRTFMRIVYEEIRRFPDAGFSWTPTSTSGAITDLTDRFFGEEFLDLEWKVQMRQDAIDLEEEDASRSNVATVGVSNLASRSWQQRGRDALSTRIPDRESDHQEGTGYRSASWSDLAAGTEEESKG